MHKCVDCDFKSVTINDLRCHYKDVHKVHKVTRTFKCNEKNCQRTFDSWKAFERHLINKHESVDKTLNRLPNSRVKISVNNSHSSKIDKNQTNENEVTSVVVSNSSFSNDTVCSSGANEKTVIFKQNNIGSSDANAETVFLKQSNCSSSNVNADNVISKQNPINQITSNVCDKTISPTDFKNIVKNNAVKFVASLYRNPSIPRSHVQTVVQGIEGFVSSFMGIFESTILDSLVQLNADDKTLENIQKFLTTFGNLFEDLETDYKRLKYFQSLPEFVGPIKHILGYKMVNRNTSTGPQLKYVPEEVQFVPLRKIFKAFLERPGVLQMTLDYLAKLKNNQSDNIKNFMESKLWKEKISKYSPTDIVIAYFIYYDDFECNDPLGPHSHKLGAIYTLLSCLPPEYSSKLNNIFLTLLFNTENKKNYSFNKILYPLIEEIKYLEETGIIIGGKRVYFVLGLLLGDNLGLHSMCGFTECFVANFSCRFCKASRCMCKEMCVEDKSLLRNETNYTADLQLQDLSKTGIKTNSCFNDIDSFHVTKNYSVDAMHDLPEGAMHYVMKHVLYDFIHVKKYFTFKFLEHRLKNFDYGPILSSN